MLEAKAVTRTRELQQILALQRENLGSSVSADEAQSQGFVTVVHTLEVLERMHALAPSIVVKEGDTLAGYALVMPVATRAFVPVLEPMFQLFGSLQYQGKPLDAHRYYVMGQICVAKAYRGRGVFDALYHEHRRLYRGAYDFVITEIATRNTRSRRAHERVGFETIHVYRDATDEWAVTLWDWH